MKERNPTTIEGRKGVNMPPSFRKGRDPLGEKVVPIYRGRRKVKAVLQKESKTLNSFWGRKR